MYNINRLEDKNHTFTSTATEKSLTQLISLRLISRIRCSGIMELSHINSPKLVLIFFPILHSGNYLKIRSDGAGVVAALLDDPSSIPSAHVVSRRHL